MRAVPSLPTRDGVSPSFVWLPNGPWQSLGEFFTFRFPAVSKDRWMLRMSRAEVRDEQGTALSLDSPYRVGACVFYYREPENETPIPFEESILFQNEQILVVDKPHFLPVTPGGRFLQETLLVRLKKKTGIDTLVPIHRLDRETAGVMLFSVDPHTRDLWQRLFRDRLIKKVYEAQAPLRSALLFPIRHCSRLVRDEQFFKMKEAAGETNSETYIRLISEHPSYGVYRLEPVTGKMHQLRVHMNALGIPILNDRFYPHVVNAADDDFKTPLKLLAQSLTFEDPCTGELRNFVSQLSL